MKLVHNHIICKLSSHCMPQLHTGKSTHTQPMATGHRAAAICWHEHRLMKTFSCSVFKSWLLLEPAQRHEERQPGAWPALSRQSSAASLEGQGLSSSLLGALHAQVQAVLRPSGKLKSKLSCLRPYTAWWNPHLQLGRCFRKEHKK